MLRTTTNHSAQGAEKYFDVAFRQGDYYTKDVGTWGGKGAEILGLKGEVKRKDFVPRRPIGDGWWIPLKGRRRQRRGSCLISESSIGRTLAASSAIG
jgi:hypothetical protein